MELTSRERLTSKQALPEGFTIEPSQVRRPTSAAKQEGGAAAASTAAPAVDGSEAGQKEEGPDEEDFEDFFDAMEVRQLDVLEAPKRNISLTLALGPSSRTPVSAR